jgi:predicted membrane-bound spermidine synthase
MRLVSSLYIGLGGQEALGFAGATVVRLLLAALVMAVPSFLMGGTLPAAVRAVTPAADVHRRALGVLYGANTLGAVFGAAVTTLYSLEAFGTRATLWIGCAIGLMAGSIAVALSKRLQPLPDQESTPSRAAPIAEPATDGSPTNTLPQTWLIYTSAALVGFSFFALELVWYRMLAPILGGTAFTFGLILCIALLGIGVGGIAYDVVFRRIRPTWFALGLTCGSEALFTIIPFALGDRLALLAAQKEQSAESFSQLAYGWSLIICITVLPVAFISGLQFPLLAALLGQGRKTVSEQLGRLYAWNTLGAIAGSLVAGFGAMPLLGAPGLWQAIAALLALLSIGILFGSRQFTVRGATVVLAMALVTACAMFAEGPTAAWRHGGIGAGRASIDFANPNEVRAWSNNLRQALVWEADGIECSVGIVRYDGLAFIVNGKTDGNAVKDAPTQIGSVALGASLHRDPKTALVIGLGTGESAGWLAELRGIEHVDVVELEPAIDEMSARSSELNCDVLHHPRVRRIYNDGREFVFTTRGAYDLVFSEPSNPYRAGVASLYTTEFYDAVRERLNPGGIFIQWLQAYEITGATVLTVMATARSEFQHVEVWQAVAGDLLLVCSDDPLQYSAAELRERIGAGKMKEALAKAWNVDDLEGFLAHFMVGSRWADSLAQAPTIVRNTDDRTVLEYSFAKSVGHQTPFSVEALRQFLKPAGFHRPAVGHGVDWREVELHRQMLNLLSESELSAALVETPEDQKLIEALTRLRNKEFAGALEQWPTAFRQPEIAILRLLLAHTYAELGRPECLELLPAMDEQFPIDSQAVRAIYYTKTNKIAPAAESFERFLSMLTKSPWLIQRVSSAALAQTINASKADRGTAGRLYALLDRPFASSRFDYDRRQCRALVAAQLGPVETIDALADLEPNIPWRADILKLRMKVYAETNHPLAERALRDWQLFERQQPRM